MPATETIGLQRLCRNQCGSTGLLEAGLLEAYYFCYYATFLTSSHGYGQSQAEKVL